ncbi:MAG: GDP-mannose 4,6-dehydratase, partial [Phycisphaeraceae bacterium]|nr:GDP-mannose 4,6-dehydratase [Phycisphaeraceae bacterium]
DAKRDWGHAKEYVKAMWLMVQTDTPDDYVISTEETHSVREFLEVAFNYLELDPYKYLKTDEAFYRPSEIHLLKGDATKAKKKLNWQYECDFISLVKEMVDSDLKLFSEHVPPQTIINVPGSAKKARQSMKKVVSVKQ